MNRGDFRPAQSWSFSPMIRPISIDPIGQVFAKIKNLLRKAAKPCGRRRRNRVRKLLCQMPGYGQA